MRLSEMQGAFLGWLASGEDAVMRRLPLAKGAEHGLGVYQNNYRAALMACLADSFPQTLRWLGEGPFEASAARHIERVPPDSWTLDDYALGFPASLAEDYPYDPEVEELARIELVLSQVFVAADAVPLDLAAMGAVDWDNARLQTVPALSILSLHSNAEEIWIALADEAPPPPVRWEQQARPVLIWRQGLLCRLRSLGSDEAGMLGHLSGAGLPFADLCKDAVAQWGEEAGIARIGQYLAQWVADGLVR